MRANVEDRGMKGDCTPLMEAATAGHVDVVRLLIKHKADVNAQSSSGQWRYTGGHGDKQEKYGDKHGYKHWDKNGDKTGQRWGQAWDKHEDKLGGQE